MEIPTINRLSGTMPSDLLEDYQNARRAVSEAIGKVTGVWPHARDHQGGDISKAMDEHAERLKKLRLVACELETIVEGLIHQI